MKNYFLLGLILLFFLISRIYKITEIPGSVYWDEASIGYNAYAVATDLKDEWGKKLPLHFRAFGEFKLPVYIYSVALLTKFIGIGELALRLPAVLYSAGTILVLYFLVLKITKNPSVGLLSALILSVSPWLFIFSRTGYEVSAGLFFFLLFLYFLISYQKRDVYILFSAVFGILSFYSYNGFRLVIPLFILLWIFSQKHRNIKIEIVALGIFLVTLIPIFRLYFQDQGAARFNTVAQKNTKEIISNYLSHFNFNFLFISGDKNLRSQQPGWGELYLIDLPLLAVGIWGIFKGKNRLLWIFPALLFIGPIPAAITKESPHALRAVALAPGFAAISALGIWKISEIFPKRQNMIYSLAVISYLLFFDAYYTDFITKYNGIAGSFWQKEYKEIFKTTKKGDVTDKYGQPYIFALYYLNFPPSEFRRTVVYNPPDKWGFSTVKSFDGFQFKKL